MPRDFVEEDLDAARLTELDLTDRPPPTRSMPLFAIHRRSDPLGPAAQWTLDMLLTTAPAPTARS